MNGVNPLSESPLWHLYLEGNIYTPVFRHWTNMWGGSIISIFKLCCRLNCVIIDFSGYLVCNAVCAIFPIVRSSEIGTVWLKLVILKFYSSIFTYFHTCNKKILPFLFGCWIPSAWWCVPYYWYRIYNSLSISPSNA